MFDVAVVGHVTRDVIIINHKKKELPGGTGFYFSMALKALGLNVALITKLHSNDGYLLDELEKIGVHVFRRESPVTTWFENRYTKGFECREQRVKAVAEPFTIKDLPNISPVFFHLGPLMRTDIPLNMLKFLSAKSKLSLDVHGFLRKKDGEMVKLEDWNEKVEGLSYVDILKADEEEAKILSGLQRTTTAAEEISKLGPKEVIITAGRKKSLIYSKNRFYHIPSYLQENIKDPTGCGDTYMAGYIYKRLKTKDFEEIGRFSAAAASLKLKNHGPFRGNEMEIQRFIERRNSG
jgi:sugar/nucleoside kinase (ribokinase family)